MSTTTRQSERDYTKLQARAIEIVSQLPPDPEDALTVLRLATELYQQFMLKQADSRSS
jgi:hypothetical protein